MNGLLIPSVRVPGVIGEVLEQKLGKVICRGEQTDKNILFHPVE
jgi:hypothetical protein